MKFFLDANVLFSAALSPQGRASTLVRIAAVGRCVFLTSPYVGEEVRRNIAMKAPGALVRLKTVLSGVALVEDAGYDLRTWAEGEGLPAKDAPILAAAVLARTDLLVTGDRRHFGTLYGRTLRVVRVVSPPDAIALVADAAEA